MTEVTIRENEAGQRLDKFLKKYLSQAPGSFLYKMLRKKNIVLNGKKATGSDPITEYTNPIAFVISPAKGQEADHLYVGEDATSDTIVYDASTGDALKGKLKVADADGEPIEEASVTSIVNAADGKAVTTAIVGAGNYVAKVSGVPGTTGNVNVNFTVSPLDLDSLSLTIADTDDISAFVTDRNDVLSAVKVNGDPIAATLISNGDLSVTNVVNPNGGVNFVAAVKGEYSVAIADAKSSDGNVTGSAVVKFTYLDEDVLIGNLYYGSKPMGSRLDISLIDGESFDVSKVKVKYGEGWLQGDDLEIVITDKDEKVVEPSALANAGNYDMTVRVKPFQEFGDTEWLGGSTSTPIKIVVAGTEVDQDTSLGFYVDGELAGDSTNVTYDGTDQLEKVSVVVKDSEGNVLTEGTDYELKVTLDGKEVDSAVDASDDPYVIEVVPLTFAFDSTGSSPEFSLYVDQVEIDRLVADVADMKFAADEKTGEIPEDGADADGSTVDNEFYVKYTGSAVEVPGVKYQVEKGGEYSYVTLDPSLYNVVSVEQGSKEVEEAVEKGTYTVTIALSDEAKSNYSLDVDEFEFTIRAYGHFTDVASDAWYATSVEQAWANYYVNGIAGTDLFAPNAEITRADVACILFNMAGGNIKNGQER